MGLLQTFSGHRVLFKSVAGMVLVSFTILILTPAVVAAQETTTTTKLASTAASSEAQLAKAIRDTQDALGQLEQTLGQGQAGTAELADLTALKQQISTLDAEVSQNFQTIEADLQTKGLPQVILDRHQTTVTQYRLEIDTLVQNITAIETATDASDRQTKTNQAKQHVDSKQHKRKQQLFDPNQLPNGRLKADPNNQPKNKKSDFVQAGLFNHPMIQLATHGSFTFDQLAGANDPAYLAASDELILSPDIQAKATELNHDPVQIYHWVLNHIEWMPTWGAMQNADLILGSQRGNAMDISSLLIALLRASGIPARYVHGTVDVDQDRFLNWAGGFTDINGAMNYAASGGIPIGALISGGVVKAVRMEHIWVEAAIDYFPSRGAINKAADQWVALDPSYKQYTFLEGLDAIAISGIDPQALAQSFVDSGTVNDTESWVTGFDSTILESAQTQAQTTLETYINDNLTDPTVGDVIGGNKTIIQDFPSLPSGLANRIVIDGARYGALPSVLQHHIRLAFGRDSIGQPLNPITYPWPVLNNQKVTLSFKPATPEDEETLASLLPEGPITDISQFPSSIPAYLIQVIPELKVNGQVVKQGASMQLGANLELVFGIQLVGFPEQIEPYTLPAGSYLSVAVVGGNVSPTNLMTLQSTFDQTKATLESGDDTLIGALTQEELLGDIFYSGTLGYYAQLIALSHVIGLTQKAFHTLAAGYGTYGFEPNVEYFFGIPRTFTPGGAAMNILMLRILGTADNDTQKQSDFNLQVGILSPVLEHAVPEQMFADDLNPGEAISAVRALEKANAAGQRVYHLTAANSSFTLSNIHHDANTMAEIQTAIATGKEVITHTDAVTVPGWTGAGYIIFDPLTGDGAFKIGGVENGGLFFNDFLGRYLNFVTLYGIPPDLDIAVELLLFGSIPKSWVGSAPALGSRNPLTSVLRGVFNSPLGKSILVRSLIVPAFTLIGTFIGFYNVTILISGLFRAI